MTYKEEFREISIKELCKPISGSEAREYLRSLLEDYDVPTEWTDWCLEIIRERVRARLGDLPYKNIIEGELIKLYIHLAHKMLSAQQEAGCYV